MHYLFYGEDTFSISEKVKKLIEKFSAIHSDLNVFHLDGVNMTLENFLETTLTLPFLGTKKLIIINNFLIENKSNELKKEVANNLDKIPKISTVVFVERGVPDMRSSLFKKLNQPKMAQKFDFSSPIRLGSWIEEEVAKEGGAILPEAKIKLQVFVGPDLWRLKNEIRKLVLYKKSRNSKGEAITPEDVEKMVAAENNSTIFNFIDALAQKDPKKALSILDGLIQSGEEEFYIFTMIIYQFRNLLLVSELLNENVALGNIASEAKLHPFVVRKNKEILRHYDPKKLIAIYQELQRFDYKIKSGILNLRLALDLLTAKLCR